MSAMPEREVFATELNEQEWLVSYLREAMKMAEKLVPESRLLAAEARVRELQAPVMCSVCVGRPLPSGKPCICGDTVRTEAAEMHGLRVRCFELEDENEKLEARVREVEAEREKFREQISKLVDDINGFYPRNQAILEESRTLRAERDALVPLARYAAPVWVDAGMMNATLRAILAREDK